VLMCSSFSVSSYGDKGGEVGGVVDGDTSGEVDGESGGEVDGEADSEVGGEVGGEVDGEADGEVEGDAGGGNSDGGECERVARLKKEDSFLLIRGVEIDAGHDFCDNKGADLFSKDGIEKEKYRRDENIDESKVRGAYLTRLCSSLSSLNFSTHFTISPLDEAFK
jgi:hypothetical protein